MRFMAGGLSDFVDVKDAAGENSLAVSLKSCGNVDSRP